MTGALLMPALSTASDVVQAVGVAAAGVLAGTALVARAPAARAAAMLAALVLAPVLLVGHLWDGAQLEPLRDRPLLSVGLLVAGLAAVAAGGWIFHRRPAAFPVAAAVALPFRVPIESGGTTANLLVPLYLVVAAGAVGYAIPRLRGSRAGGEEERAGLEWALAAALGLYGLQAAYSSDFDRALEQVVFFYVPFALLFALLARVPWTPGLSRTVLGVLVGLAALFVAVGAWEYATRHVLLNPRIINANEFESYFRVNSLFFDPNIYGRFLVVVLLGVAAWMLWARGTPAALGGAVALAVLFGGLLFTFSQSSFTALLAGLTVLGALRWGVRRAALVAAGLAVAAAALLLLAPGAVRLDLGDSDSVRDATSGRWDLIEGGVELAAGDPVLGWGPGAFRREYRRQEKASDRQATAASHTIPVTVTAEQGVVGLAAYLVLLWLGFGRLLRRAATPARAAVAAAFAALVVHTLLYAAFLEDPLAWALLGVGTALRRPRDP